MAPSAKDLRILYQRSGNRCAFPSCTKRLEFSNEEADQPKARSEVAHIVGESLDGPRGNHPLQISERDKFDNLILLCEEHHHLVDTFEETYTVERLHVMKSDHEQLIDKYSEIAVQARQTDLRDPMHRYVSDIVHSTLLPVLEMPSLIYSVGLDESERSLREINKELLPTENSAEMAPFILRKNKLYSFQDLRRRNGPFANLVNPRKVEQYSSLEWWDSPDTLGWYIALLNRSLNKLTGRKGLNFDKEHERYFFMPKKLGQAYAITYRGLNQEAAERNVVWQPVTKATNLPKSYWNHLAISLKFHRVSKIQWCLSLRPELHLTKDGKTAYESSRKGSKITKRTSRRFNFDMLGDLQFWRHFLSNGTPRIVFNFGPGQRVIVASKLLDSQVEWPGIPEKYSKTFKNVEYQDDLFSLGEFERLVEYDDGEYDEADAEEEFE